jgi:hypothetical protein
MLVMMQVGLAGIVEGGCHRREDDEKQRQETRPKREKREREREKRHRCRERERARRERAARARERRERESERERERERGGRNHSWFHAQPGPDMQSDDDPRADIEGNEEEMMRK